jgi:hypothetical protein
MQPPFPPMQLADLAALKAFGGPLYVSMTRWNIELTPRVEITSAFQPEPVTFCATKTATADGVSFWEHAEGGVPLFVSAYVEDQSHNIVVAAQTITLRLGPRSDAS